MRDPIIDEIRRVREAYAARFNHDVEAIYEDIRKHQEQSGRTYVRLPPRPATSVRWSRRWIAPVEQQASEQPEASR